MHSPTHSSADYRAPVLAMILDALAHLQYEHQGRGTVARLVVCGCRIRNLPGGLRPAVAWLFGINQQDLV